MTVPCRFTCAGSSGSPRCFGSQQPLYRGLNAAGLWPDGGSDLFGVATTLLFVHGWTPDTINLVVPGGWTIGVEMTFYAIFPLIAAMVTTLPRAIGFLIASVMLSVVANTAALHLLASVEPGKLGFFVYYWFPNSLQVFAFGCLTYHMLRYAPASKAGSAVLLTCAGVVALYCAWWSVPWYSSSEFLLSRGPLTGFASLLLALGLARTSNPWLVNRVTCYVGKVSFSAYLVHFLVVFPIAQYFGPFHANSLVSLALCAVFLAFVMGVTVCLSALTYRFIERPCIQAGNRFIRDRVLTAADQLKLPG